MFRYFEAAEEEFLRSIGFAFTLIETPDIAFPRVHAECDISGALAYDDEIDVEIGIDRVGVTSYTLAYRVLKQQAPVARGRIVAVCMNRNSQKSHPLPAGFANALRSAGPLPAESN
jgi:acyl-CoA thioester hydrolase